MELTDLEHHVLAYYLAGHANELNIATRWYPYGELVLIVEDKITVAVRKFGMKARGKAKPAAKAFIDRMIAEGAWSTKQNEFGGAMHQFQADTYRKALKDWQASDPVVQKAQAEGADYWTDTFAALTA